ncbi:MAG: hypothetical protein MJK13_15010, partial [Pseudomonadales bacterium]|nr:hypothetical protein [Pseudomonadales bacterium]
MTSFFSEYWSDLSQLFSNSQQRLYFGYLLCAAIIAFIWLKHSGHNLKHSLIQATGFQHWFSQSALADYKLILINKVFFLLMLPLLVTKLAIATAMFELMHQSFSQRNSIDNDLPVWLIISARQGDRYLCC